MSKASLVVVALALFLLGVFYGRVSKPASAESNTEQKNGAQQEPKYDAKDPATWPASRDAVMAAPNNHKVLLENDRVRVLEVTVRPGEKEPVHAHRWPGVLYVDSGGHFLDYDGEGKVIFDSRKANPPIKYPRTVWREFQAAHAVENLSEKKPIHIIRVELKK